VEFLTIRELSKSPHKALARLAQDGKAVLTNNGKPEAFLLETSEKTFEKTLTLIQKLEFQQSVEAMQQESARNGNNKMTLDDINAEINASRQERKVQKSIL
jgi:hypothetical protein